MKLAIVGSRNLTIKNLSDYIDKNITEIVSGGAKGIDLCAEKYAKDNNLLLTVFLPEYSRYGKAAPLKRNTQIIEYSDELLIFWDNKSKGTKFVIDKCNKNSKKFKLVVLK